MTLFMTVLLQEKLFARGLITSEEIPGRFDRSYLAENFGGGRPKRFTSMYDRTLPPTSHLREKDYADVIDTSSVSLEWLRLHLAKYRILVPKWQWSATTDFLSDMRAWLLPLDPRATLGLWLAPMRGARRTQGIRVDDSIHPAADLFAVPLPHDPVVRFYSLSDTPPEQLSN